MKAKECVIYIGDFDLRNENVQAHLVKNNGKILNKLGYTVAYIGINREATTFSQLEQLAPLEMGNNVFFELPYTLHAKGLLACGGIIKHTLACMDGILKDYAVKAVISYQAPTYAVILKHIAKWCGEHGAKYIVNCADLPVFHSQPPIRRLIMKWNWRTMHGINGEYADGIIAVSRCISRFYHKENRPSLILPPLFDEEIALEVTPNETATFLYAGTPFVTLDREVNPQGMKDRLDKVIDLFLELSKRKVNYQFRVVGITKESYTACVPRHKDVLQRQEQITFLGRKPHGETLDMLTRADFMINIRDNNLMTEAGVSTKVVESVSVGTPVVMNPIGDTFSYLEEGVSGFALKNDLAADTQLLESLCGLSAEERYKRKKACQQQRVFSPEKYEQKLDAFLKQVLA